MAENSIIIKESVDIVDYSAAVLDIVNKFFDEDGNYTPHFGRINSVGVFFKYFVDEDSFEKYLVDNGYNLDSFDGDNSWVEIVLGDKTLRDLYNQARGEMFVPGFALDFANAYLDATNIVEYKKNSLEKAIDNIGKTVMAILESLNGSLSEANLDKLTSLASVFEKNRITDKSVADTYFDSDKFKEAMETPIAKLSEKKG